MLKEGVPLSLDICFYNSWKRKTWTEMSSGHFSASDRYKNMKERAFEYAFVMKALGCRALVKPPGGVETTAVA